MNQTMAASSLIVQDWRAAPAMPGMALAEVDTPALLVDLDAMEYNIAAVAERLRPHGVALRPHGKAHKSPDISHRQIAAGAIGICCQKASEAEEFALSGVEDILITNQVVGPLKVARVARLAERARVSLCVDNIVQVHEIGAAARQHAVQLGVLVELDVGQGRCGVRTAEEVLALAQAVQTYAPHLSFKGLQAYHGSSQHMREPAERAATVARTVERVKAVVAQLAEAGIACPTITGGGTGTYLLEAASGLYTEVQAGTYALLDVDYSLNTLAADWPVLRHALFGYCTVISLCDTHAVLDGGLKAFAVDSGLPRLLYPGWRVKGLSDEHTVIVPEANAATLAVGDKVRLVPGHCDPTINLHDWLIAFRGNSVEEVWPVAARGALF